MRSVSQLLLRLAGGIAVMLLAFWVALHVMNKPSDLVANKGGKEAAFHAIVEQARAGRSIFVRFDDNPKEDREPSGAIRCSDKAADGYLGIFIAGGVYQITYSEKAGSWTVSGPDQRNPLDGATGQCGAQASMHSAADLKPRQPRPEKGELALWGVPFSFDAQLSVFDSTGAKVGRVQPTP